MVWIEKWQPFLLSYLHKKDGRDRDISIEIQMKLDILPFEKTFYCCCWCATIYLQKEMVKQAWIFSAFVLYKQLSGDEYMIVVFSWNKHIQVSFSLLISLFHTTLFVIWMVRILFLASDINSFAFNVTLIGIVLL